MAEKLIFSLVSPERELFSGEVDQVDVPGVEGDFGVLAQHAPFMSAIRTGTMTVFNDGTEVRYFVQGGFADVTPDGLTVLAETAKPLAEINADWVSDEIGKAESHIETLEGDARIELAQHIEGLKQVQAG